MRYLRSFIEHLEGKNQKAKYRNLFAGRKGRRVFLLNIALRTLSAFLRAVKVTSRRHKYIYLDAPLDSHRHV